MINNLKQLSNVSVLLNKILNTLIKRKFGKQYSIRLSSLNFINNRTGVYYFHNCSEIIFVKSNKPVSIIQLIQIKEYLLFYINCVLKCMETKSYMEVTDIEVVII
jgi:hypothetical protein